MVKRVFVDYHHSSLLRSLISLFEDRLGFRVYRPIGLQWFIEGHWRVNDQYETAKQFLTLGQSPVDGTAALNIKQNRGESRNTGIYYCYDPGDLAVNRACTLNYFKKHQFDYLIASIPAHIPVYERLIAKYQPKAKLIVQMGNMWPDHLFADRNVLASVKARPLAANAVFYHQEFDLEIFHASYNKRTRRVYSFVNVLENMPEALNDFLELERLLKPRNYQVRSFGGQNRDGNMTGPRQLADKMRQADYILHTKPGGDGYGHIIHNAYAVGRPVIIRKSQYKGQLAKQLFAEGTYLDIEELGLAGVAQAILAKPDLGQAGFAAHQRFRQLVDFNNEAERIGSWLNSL